MNKVLQPVTWDRGMSIATDRALTSLLGLGKSVLLCRAELKQVTGSTKHCVSSVTLEVVAQAQLHSP